MKNIRNLLNIMYIILGILIINTNAFSDDTEEEAANVIQILETNYPWAVKMNSKVLYIKKVNMGIQGGDNWFVIWKSGLIECYLVNSKNEITAQNAVVRNSDIKRHTSFDVMKDIPGVRVADSSCMIGDYNNDGLDEVLNFGFYGSWFGLQIYGYDRQKNEFTDLVEVPFDIIDPENGPSPV